MIGMFFFLKGGVGAISSIQPVLKNTLYLERKSVGIGTSTRYVILSKFKRVSQVDLKM